jgi:hypothetical protein
MGGGSAVIRKPGKECRYPSVSATLAVAERWDHGIIKITLSTILMVMGGLQQHVSSWKDHPHPPHHRKSSHWRMIIWHVFTKHERENEKPPIQNIMTKIESTPGVKCC